ncbi:MAG: hypothetical protein QOH62_110 [Solirubrobacteraceae bacterium]|nr:hypothetical protein [Solirubrobacteraceae bacterium]
MAAEPAFLPEASTVYWRPRADGERLDRRGRLWTLTTVAHVVPFIATAILLCALAWEATPVALACLAHAWIIPALYAQRGANVVRPRPKTTAAAEQTALGLLGDLVGHDARELHAQTGLVMERGRLGTWLVGEAGALLVRGRKVWCFCVRVNEPDLPSADRIAHLLLALRTDEQGFATVANLAFAGAPRRVRARMRAPMRPALDRAAKDAR